VTDEKQNEPSSDTPDGPGLDADTVAQAQAEEDARVAADAVDEADIAAGDEAGILPVDEAAAPDETAVQDAADPFGSDPVAGVAPDVEQESGFAPGPDHGAPAAARAGVQYGIGPFSLREVILAGVWLVAFVVSFFSTSSFGFRSVWTSGIDWILTIGVPTVAVFLVVLRRLSPSGIRRVGSLGIDQFASVAFSVAAVLWLGNIWSQVGVSIAGGPWVTTWVIWVEFVLMLAGVVLTVLAPVIPGLAEDFRERPETIAHRTARGARPVTARPRPVAASAPYAEPEPVGSGAAEPAAADAFAPLDESVPEQAATETAPAETVTQPAQQAFWALAPEERDVVDESGTPLFRIGPTAWALVIEDRGSSFVIRHEDGRVGLLTDVSGVTRG
jgi:hypothetical protein